MKKPDTLWHQAFLLSVITLLHLINGVASSQIDVNDRGLQYGDGFFTTMLVTDGHAQWWDHHLARLQTSAQRLYISGIDWHRLERDVFATASAQPSSVIKVVITRGSGGRGYSPQGCNLPSVIVSQFAVPAHVDAWQQNGISLGVAKFKLGVSPALAGLKTLNRLEQVLGRQEVLALGVDDAVFCNVNGDVIETNAANIFWRKDELVYTCDLCGSGVAGVMSQVVLDTLSAENIPFNVVKGTLDALRSADEIWITNSVQQVVPVRLFDGRVMQDFAFSRRLQAIIMEGNR
ncbi:aminodeoxychorismate lyase [Corallincola holothuriorum]|uniref:Aminodeoxychorismate lyase n=1 Tax=Corallincola holothuriorum TaxID=2282215 RepID=A0A368NQ90_9GAMM|nr:aminodeoxychorismate lyase [Corallincola holothuriorum]